MSDVVPFVNQTDALRRGSVVSVIRKNDFLVKLPDLQQAIRCRVLRTSDQGRMRIERSDEVLVLHEAASGTGIIIGRIEPASEANDADVPDEIVIEAAKNLTLKVGDGSITIREDGRILIKGKDLVSHAKRMNRIRGGSVEIN